MCNNIIKLIGMFFALALLSACGGGGGGGGGGGNDNTCGTVVDIGVNSVVDGFLQGGDCRVDDIFPGSGDTSFVDEYRVTLTTGGTLTITMRSTDLDSFLALLNTSTSCVNGCNPALIITTDDDSGGGLDALIDIDLAAGTYGIGVNSILPGPGSYTLETSFTPDIWSPTSTSGAPEARRDHTSVWTGTQMIVWGGLGQFSTSLLATGARFDLASNSWAQTTLTGAPTPRRNHTAVWTGSEMMIWGGYDGNTLGDGAGYFPDTNTWLPISTVDQPSARVNHTAVWTGTEMILWGGFSALASANAELGTGARYNPNTDTWTSMSMTNAPEARGNHTAIWTGSEMIVWGGQTDVTFHNSGGAYDPVTDTWTSISLVSAPVPKSCHSAVWTGNEMIIFGGQTNAGLACFLSSDATGARYNPATDSWNPITNAPISSSISSVRSIWSGDRLITWFDNAGARYNPVNNTWVGVSADGSPSSRRRHTLVWTGSAMIVWGGDFAGPLDTGGIYLPQVDTTP